jgi:hypothetical protein
MLAPALLGKLTVPLGYLLLGLGAVMFVLPGPGAPVLIAGLVLLSRRQRWARGALRRLKLRIYRAARARREARGEARPRPPRPPRGSRMALGAALLLAAAGPPAAARAATPWLDVEAGAVGSAYNDVRIPGDSGTRFSLTDDLSARSAPFLRVRAGADLGRHEVWALYAPLKLEASGAAPADLDFFGATFPAGTPLRGTYRFDSYRVGWRYAVVKRDRLEVAVGAAAKIRDAAISICAATCTVRSNTGFVPLASARLHWTFAGPFGLLLDADGLAGGPGRAVDATAALTWRAAENVSVRVGGRVVEGGSDTDSVYNFALLAYAAGGVTVRF